MNQPQKLEAGHKRMKNEAQSGISYEFASIPGLWAPFIGPWRAHGIMGMPRTSSNEASESLEPSWAQYNMLLLGQTTRFSTDMIRYPSKYGARMLVCHHLCQKIGHKMDLQLAFSCPPGAYDVSSPAGRLLTHYVALEYSQRMSQIMPFLT